MLVTRSGLNDRVVEFEGQLIKSAPNGTVEVAEAITETARSSPADNDVVGRVSFYGNNDATAVERIRYGRMDVKSTDVSDATEDGAIEFYAMKAGAETLVGGLGATGTVTLSSNAGTVNTLAGKITTESLTTAAGADATLTITCNKCAAADIVLLTRNGGTSTAGTPIFSVVPGAGSFVITLSNKHASAAFDGTFIIGFQIVKA